MGVALRLRNTCLETRNPLQGFRKLFIILSLASSFSGLCGAAPRLPLVFVGGEQYFGALNDSRIDINSSKFEIHSSSKRIQISFPSADPAAQPEGVSPLESRGNLLMAGKAVKGLPIYRAIRVRGIYPAVDLTYFGQQDTFIAEFTVAPGGSYAPIRVAFEGDPGVPVVTQTVDGREVELAGAFKLVSEGVAGVEIGNYDPSLPLSIRMEREIPAEREAVSVVRDGDQYLVTSLAGDVVVARLDAAGNPRYLTLAGGTGDDQGHAIAVDAEGGLYVAGSSNSADFPDAKVLGRAWTGATHAYAFRLNPEGTALTLSAHWGGNGRDEANAIAVDGDGEIYVAGETTSTDFPVTAGSAPHSSSRAAENFVARLDRTGSAFLYSTCLGTGIDKVSTIRVDGFGEAAVTGSRQGKAMALKLNAAGTSLLEASTTVAPLAAAAFTADPRQCRRSGIRGRAGPDLGRGQRRQRRNSPNHHSADSWNTGFETLPSLPARCALHLQVQRAQRHVQRQIEICRAFVYVDCRAGVQCPHQRPEGTFGVRHCGGGGRKVHRH